MKTRKKNLLVGVLLTCSLLMAGTSSWAEKKAEKKFPDHVKEMVGKAKKSVKLSTDMEGFKQVYDSKNYDLIVDVREPSEFEDGHIPGAINIPRGLAEFQIWKKVGFPENTDTGKKIYLYCKSGGRSALTTLSLEGLGFTDVTMVDMKIMDWKKAGYPLVEE